MADAYTTRVGLIKPESGQSLNTWGTKLNDNNFDIVDKGLAGFQNISVATSFSLTRTNGDDDSTQINKGLRLAGTPTAAFDVTHLSYEHIILVKNVSGQTATHKVSGGSGVALSTGQIALLGYNSAEGDIVNLTPNVVASNFTVGGTVTASAATANTHLPTLLQVSNLIAAASVSGDGSFLVSADDTTRKFAEAALSVSASGDLTAAYSTSNPGGNETLLLTLTHTPYWAAETVVTTGTTAAVDRGIYACRTSTGAITIQLPASGRVQIKDVDGAAQTNNITVDPPSGDSIATGSADENLAIDTNLFAATFTRRPSGTNWSVS